MRTMLTVIGTAVAALTLSGSALAAHTVTETYTKTAGKNTFVCTVTYVDENDSGTLDPGDTVISVACSRTRA